MDSVIEDLHHFNGRLVNVVVALSNCNCMVLTLQTYIIAAFNAEAGRSKTAIEHASANVRALGLDNE